MGASPCLRGVHEISKILVIYGIFINQQFTVYDFWVITKMFLKSGVAAREYRGATYASISHHVSDFGGKFNRSPSTPWCRFQRRWLRI